MKTETINVPHFEGYRCIGWKFPEEGEYFLYLGNLHLSGGSHVADYLTYEKLLPKRYVFEETGEYRPVKRGDYYLFENHIFYRSNDEESLSYYTILRKVDE